MTAHAGIVANEFFDARIGRMGGFGWVAQSAARALRSANGLRPLFLSGDYYSWDDTGVWDSFGTELVLNEWDRSLYAERLRQRAVELVLTVDYRQTYDYPLEMTAEAPVVMWVQDPRPPEDVEKVHTLEVPGQPGVAPQGISFVDCTGLADFVRAAAETGRPVAFASPAPGLLAKVPGTYGVSPSALWPLPYSLDLRPGTVSKAARPRVVFLGRLDPIKRPWLFVELARRFPSVEFLFLGKSHFEGAGAWEPRGLPDNVRLLGHVDGEAKSEILRSAWVLVNPSIHEALPVSFVEALAFEVPILSCQDPEEVASRFGFYTGRWDGTGLEGVPRFAEGLEWLLADDDRRAELGRAGREWALATHGTEPFLTRLESLRRALSAGITVAA